MLREQISRAEHAELSIRTLQVRVAQAEARTAAAISSETVAHESLRRVQDQRIQEWTGSGTPVPAIGEPQVLIGTPHLAWGGMVEIPPAPPVAAEQPPAAAREGTPVQPQENGVPEADNNEELLIPLEDHSDEGSPRE